MNKFFISALLLTAISMPAFAGATCTIAKAEWQPKETLKAQLLKANWQVNNIKTSNGCYEVYGKDGTGKRRETFFNPKSFVELGED
jgi:hypothetical protein